MDLTLSAVNIPPPEAIAAVAMQDKASCSTVQGGLLMEPNPDEQISGE